MGYTVIPVIASIVLVLHHAALTNASRWSKVVVTVAVAVSLVLWQYYPQWSVLATLMQVAASVYMIVYSKVRDSAGP